MYWDISLHIDDGRDAGPLANPAHYFILVGLFGIFAAGVLAMTMPKDGERPGPSAVRITKDWYAPVGGILMAVCGGYSLIAFPLDDVWHRIFGQDVTLWGPTHLMLIGGAGMTLIAQAILLREGMQAREAPARSRRSPLVAKLRRIGLAGGLLIGASTFQAEFDFGVPQFSQVLHPALIAFAAGLALVTARLMIGPGGALGAAAFFLLVRGIIGVLVGPGLGEVFPYMPLYLAEAACVEIVVLVIGRERPLAVRRGVRPGDRDRRLCRRVRLDPGLHAAPVGRGPAAGGRDHGRARGPRRRHAGRARGLGTPGRAAPAAAWRGRPSPPRSS